jgi:O-antigen/teichoic acid export membrane protein
MGTDRDAVDQVGGESSSRVDAGRLTAPDVGLVVVRGASVRALGYGGGLALSALGSVLLFRYFSVDDFGRYMTVATLIAIVSGVSEAGLSTVGGREIAFRVHPESRDRLVSDLLGIRLAFTALGVLAAIAFAIAVGYDRTLVAGTALMGIGLVLTSAQLTMMLPLSAELLMGRLTTAELVKQAVTVAGIGVLVAVEAALLAFFGVQIVVGIVILAATPWLMGRASLVWRPTFGWAPWKALLRLALPLAISATIAVLYFRLLVVLCSVISTPYETGLLATSFRIVELLYGLGAIVASVSLPVLSATARESQRLQYMTQRMSEVALLAACYLSVLVFAVAAPILGLLGGTEYEAAASVLRIQVFALIPSFLAQVWLTALIAIGRLTALATASAVGLVLAGGLGVVLIDADGARGAAVAALVGETALAITLFVMLTASRPAHRLRLGYAWKPVCASLALIAVAELADVALWVQVVAGTAAFVAVAVATRAIPSEIRDAFLQRRLRSGRQS